MTRVKISDNQIKYDQSHDVLHVFFYPEYLTTDDEEFPGILIRRSIKDEQRIAGLTIMDFLKRKESSGLDQLLPDYDFTNLTIANH